MIAKLPANVEIDDLIQVGMIGLSDALSRFDAGQGVQFETFATQRIRGAMLDELRGTDWMSRGDRRHQRSIEAAVHVLEHASTAVRTNPDLALAVARLLARRLAGVTAYLADIKRQYADSNTHLALMDQVLGNLVAANPADERPGSERSDVPGY
jgi:RNA polymerase sigma factor (sigma-70 family)